jgi:cytochrome c biogenesis protein
VAASRALPDPARAILAGRPANPLARAGRGIYGLLTSVPFAVLQIVTIALAGVAGIILPQLPSAAFQSAADYITQMDIIRARLEPSLGPGAVAFLERLQLFRVFSAWWFTLLLALLAVSIVVCTLDRTPHLWRQSRHVRVLQPDAFYEPSLPDRAVIATGLDTGDVRSALRRARFRVREVEAPDGTRYLYGDRHQYVKMATLISHAGLVGFLVAAAVTSRFGFEAGLLLPVGQAIPVESVGTADLISVKNLSFRAPQDSSGRFTDFATDLAVYQGGREIARKTIRVNDPLSASGYTFHQNFFGPAIDLTVRERSGGLLWSGPVPLDATASGLPTGQLVVPGRDAVIQLVLAHPGTATPLFVVAVLPTALDAAGNPTAYQTLFQGLAGPGDSAAPENVDFDVTVDAISAYSGIIVRRDPGAPLVWLSFVLLVLGLAITFYFPRRRVWARISAAGEVRLAAHADRYVDLRREFGALLSDLVARRRPGSGSNP